ncbi:Spiroplasmavirus-related protein [Spiroplasma kunkelii CR2-3x]|uniref:Spiroplasmavirus-related protein n=1 Tax=Spiroplasma kunkelii CR2-3x TaxID=273035 RepID=A0A0K2JEQ0_SPIKU|nr:Spiroplasmavirus-related protein [Spiroplasma kunkelii CR2-3x]
MDFLQDSYSTGVVYDKPSSSFFSFYQMWDSWKNTYMVKKFYDVKKENFLNDLTDFIYAFAVKYNMYDVSKKIVDNVGRYKENRYPRVKLKQDNWKLIPRDNDVLVPPKVIDSTDKNKYVKEDDRKYIVIYPYLIQQWNIIKTDTKNINNTLAWSSKAIIYYWDGVGEPQLPTINENTGEITDWNTYQQNFVKEFINFSLIAVLQENIRVQ